MLRRAALGLIVVASACRQPAAPAPEAPSSERIAIPELATAPEPEPAPEPAPEPSEPIEDALPPLPTDLAAEVGGVPITIAAFRSIYDLKVKKYTERGRTIPSSADNRYRKSVAQRLVYHEVLRQEAERLGVTYDAARLAEREALGRRDIADWPRHLERRGETEASLRDMYIGELREAAILEKLGKLAITRAEIEARYTEIQSELDPAQPRVRVSQIVFPFDFSPAEGSLPAPPPPSGTPAEIARAREQARAHAWNVYAKARRKGADFAALARKHSEGADAFHGGDMGVVTRDGLPVEVGKVAFALAVGRVSKPVQTQHAYHIVKVTGRWPAGVLPRSAVEPDIRKTLHQRKLQTSRRELKADLLTRYPIVDHIAPTLKPLPVR